MLTISASAAIWTVVYPESELGDDPRDDFPVALLDLALQKTGVRYRLKPSSYPLSKTKSLKLLRESLEVNVVWAMTDISREQQLRPIRIPIMKGLSGIRVLMLEEQHPLAQQRIDDLFDLISFKPVQGLHWPDTKILQANGFNVMTSNNMVEGVQMLKDGTADFFPRSITEIEDDLNNNRSNGLGMKKNLALVYPTAIYYFTNKQNLTLSRLIETGLQRAIEDGSYQELFERFFAQSLINLEWESVSKFYLDNPLLPERTPLNQAHYWHISPVSNDSK